MTFYRFMVCWLLLMIFMQLGGISSGIKDISVNIARLEK